MLRSRLFLAGLPLFLVVACSSPEATPAPAPAATASAPTTGMTANMSATHLGSTPVSDKDLAKYEKNYKDTKAIYDKGRVTAEAKDAYLIATVYYGSGKMYAASLDAKEKY